LKKKPNLDKEYQTKLDAWAEKYNPNGNFPLTLLIDSDGNIIKKWTGNIVHSVEDFLAHFEKL
jgi:hypothetical protein